MARKVKCAITGEVGTSDTFVKINGKYYKSQAIYDHHMQNKEYMEKTKHLILDCIGWQEGEPFPLLLTKKLKEFSFYSGETIYKTVKECENSIRWYMQNKDFKDTAGRIFYICAIISNKIGDVHRQRQINEKRIKQQNHSVEEARPVVDFSTIGTSVKGKDISNFLEDDLWN